MAPTRYRWTATGSHTESGEPTESAGAIDAESPRQAEAMIIGYCKSNGMQADDIVLTITRNS